MDVKAYNYTVSRAIYLTSEFLYYFGKYLILGNIRPKMCMLGACLEWLIPQISTRIPFWKMTYLARNLFFGHPLETVKGIKYKKLSVE